MKILLIIILANSAAPLLAAFHPQACRLMLDGGRRLPDGKFILGRHKSLGGLAGGIAAGALGGFLIGVPIAISFPVAAASMLGDLFTSFLKRRIGLREGEEILLFDQVFEGGFPMLWCHWMYALPGREAMALLLLFCAAAFPVSRLAAELLPARRAEGAFRMVRSQTSFREWRACHTALSPFARLLNFENVIYYRWIMRGAFTLVGLYGRGRKNALDVRLRRFEVGCADLPEAFDGYRVLFISDLHLDGLSGLCDRLIGIVRPIEADLCLLGGDYRMEMYGDFTVANRKLGRLVRHIRARDGIFGILGNHDCLEIAPELEDSRICMLINESVAISRNGSEISIVGVDDPHYYKCHDLKKAFEEVPPDGFTILVAHSPEVISDARKVRIDLCLCGHTHGGQIRLPLVGAPFTHCRLPRKYSAGFWRCDRTIGYTSFGAGSSGIPVRFNCPPEIVLMILRRGCGGLAAQS